MTVVTRYAGHLARCVGALLAGRPVQAPHLGSNTLDLDDVRIARSWLGKPAFWSEEDPVREFHSRFAEWNGSAHAFAFGAGRIALSGCLDALGLTAGDEVILPGYTCVVVANALRFAQLQPIYADIELDTFGLDAEAFERAIRARTKAVILHHLYGLVCRDYEEIVRIARKHGLFVIEDCAQSTGAEYRGSKVGNMGDVAFYSLEQSKVLTTGQGGVASTNNVDIASRLKEYWLRAPVPQASRVSKLLHTVVANYYCYKDPQRWWRAGAARWYYRKRRRIVPSTTAAEVAGRRPSHYGERMVAPIAALAINQLSKLDTYNSKRRAAAMAWQEWCATRHYQAPLELPGSKAVYLRYPVLVEAERKRDLRWAMAEHAVVPGVWFVSHLHPSTTKVQGCPCADTAVEQCINFPCLP